MEISGNSTSVSECQPPLGGTFGKILEWHIENNTRPIGEHDAASRKGPRRRLAEAIGGTSAEAIASTERKISFWIAGTRPNDLLIIEKALFGDPPAHETWRRSLRRAYEELPKTQRPLAGDRPGASPPLAEKTRVFEGVPNRLVGFVGREADIKTIADLFGPFNAASPARAAICGLGGMGKTALASEYVYRTQNTYGGVWWCPAETRDHLLRSLARLAGAILPGTHIEADAEIAARQGLRALSQQLEPWLIVYDNVLQPQSISDLLPPKNAKLLITSRFSDWKGHARSVLLGTLSSTESISLLSDLSEREDPVGAARLAELLGHLPLALNHAGFTCRRTNRSFAQYTALIEELLDLVPSGVDYPASVFATFKQALADAASVAPEAETMMSFLAHCAPERIPSYLTEGVTASAATDLRALLVLGEFSLLKNEVFEDRTPALLVHRLVQTVSRSLACKKGMTTQTLLRLKQALVASRLKEEDEIAESASRFEKLVPHVLILQERLSVDLDHSVDLTRLLMETGSTLKDRLLIDQAEILLRRCMENCKREGHPESLIAKCAQILGSILKISGKHDKAVVLYQKSQTILSKISNSDEDEKTHGHLLLASAFEALRQFDKAENEYRLAASINNSREAANYMACRILEGFAGLRLRQGRTSEAKTLLQLVLQKLEAGNVTIDHVAASASLDLGVIFEREKNPAAARLLIGRAVSIYESIRGLDHPTTAAAKAELAVALCALKEFQQAREMCTAAILALEGYYGPEHNSLEIPTLRLADIMVAEGNHQAAATLYKKALKLNVREKNGIIIGKTGILIKLADIFAGRAEFEVAQEYLEMAVRGTREEFGPNDINHLGAVCKLADLFEKSDQFEAAQKLFEVVTERCPRTHPLLSDAVWRRAGIFDRLNRRADAKEAYYEALKIVELSGRTTSIDLIDLAHRVADWTSRRGWAAEAISKLEKCILDIEKLSSDGRGLSANIYAAYGRALARSGSFEEARKHLHRSLDVIARWPSFDRGGHLLIANDLAILEFGSGDRSKACVLFGKVVNISEALYGVNSHECDRAKVDWSLSIFYTGQTSRALDICKVALDSLFVQLGALHPWTLHAAAAVAVIYDKSERSRDAADIRAAFRLPATCRPQHRPSWDDKADFPLITNRGSALHQR